MPTWPWESWKNKPNPSAYKALLPQGKTAPPDRISRQQPSTSGTFSNIIFCGLKPKNVSVLSHKIPFWITTCGRKFRLFLAESSQSDHENMQVAQGHFRLLVRNWCHDNAGVMDKYQPAKPLGAQEEHNDTPYWSKGLKDYLRTCNIINETVLDWFSLPDWTPPALGQSVQPPVPTAHGTVPYSLGHARYLTPSWTCDLQSSFEVNCHPCLQQQLRVPQDGIPEREKLDCRHLHQKGLFNPFSISIDRRDKKNWKNTVLSQKLPIFDSHSPEEKCLGEK